jgi:hypothetical protein
MWTLIGQSVDVLVTDLGSVDIDEEVLSVAELGKAIELASAPGLRPYLAACTWMRQMLAVYLVAQPVEIVFETDGRGIPVVASPETDLSFSLSYSDWIGVLAIGFGQEVGVAVDSYAGAEKSVIRRQALTRATGSGWTAAMADIEGESPVFVDGFGVSDIDIGDGLVAAVAAPWGAGLNLVVDDTSTKSGTRSATSV